MRLICPNCDAHYEVDALMLAPEGRDVQCSACGQVWFHGPTPDATAAEKLAPPAANAPIDTAPSFAPQLSADDVEEARFLTDADLTDDEEEPEAPLDWREARDRALVRDAQSQPLVHDVAVDGRAEELQPEAELLSDVGTHDLTEAPDFKDPAAEDLVWGDTEPPADRDLAERRSWQDDRDGYHVPDPDQRPEAEVEVEADFVPDLAIDPDAAPAARSGGQSSPEAEHPALAPVSAELLDDWTYEDAEDDAQAPPPPSTPAQEPDRFLDRGDLADGVFDDTAAEPPHSVPWTEEAPSGADYARAPAESDLQDLAAPEAPFFHDAQISPAAHPASHSHHAHAGYDAPDDDFDDFPPEAPMAQAAPDLSRIAPLDTAAAPSHLGAGFAALTDEDDTISPPWPESDLQPIPSFSRRRPGPPPNLPPEDPEDEPEPLTPEELAALMRRRPRLDEEKLALLREEAERETRARAAESARAAGRGVEMQPELGLPEAEPPSRLHIGPRTAPPDPETERPAPSSADPQNRNPRRELLPDIERINQTLSASGNTRQNQERAALEAAAVQRKGFRRGFVVSLLLAVTLALVYHNAQMLSVRVPAAAPLLSGFVAVIDEARLGIDQLLRRLLDSQQI